MKCKPKTDVTEQGKKAWADAHYVAVHSYDHNAHGGKKHGHYDQGKPGCPA
jgi:hypothetical protein